ncbi:PREDICTED: vacuolar protein sorting-associated protein VTA1 homolog isoform X1 [Lipotes vexillifer]|uniref:Vacuolar protein sorting-associated protein VTA1 homolog n=1 Tax=Lipotes vexillifer TaxID=118797 RepID=A0A340WNP9_LIPVE|nr:PREDICTED: vacuolar protein sorting-associated protein VTA1 homolog isoform X1 [Lipotes vexillifer]
MAALAPLPPLPPLPPQFKSIQHHLRTAQEHDKRDPVVAYYCRLYAMQTGMKIDSKTPECRKFLSKLMDQLEALKKQLGDNEAVTQEIVGSAHLENYALKMFLYADNEDRAGRFHKNMIKSFYTASLLIDVITVFGELTDENVKHRKYARWKATYIHNCLKNGETPQAGPVGIEEDNDVEENEDAGTASLPSQPPQASSSTYDPSNMPSSSYTGIQIPPGAHAPANTPAEVPHSTGVASNTIQPTPQTIPAIDPALFNTVSQGDIRLTPEDFARAQKYCKYAGSALQYEDVSTAVQNLQKALKLLTTGRE